MKQNDDKLQSIQGYIGRAIFKDINIGSDQNVFTYKSFSNETIISLKKELKINFTKDIFRCYKIGNSFYVVYINYVMFNLTKKDLYMNLVILNIISGFEPILISNKLDTIGTIKETYLISKDKSIFEIGLALLHQTISDLDIKLVYCDSNLGRFNAFSSDETLTEHKIKR